MARPVTHGLYGTKEYKTWNRMMMRCYGNNAVCTKWYRAKGVKVCLRWHTFIHFYEDMGKAPTSKHSLDRIDHTGNYEPGNCRWADAYTQQNNRSNNHLITYRGETKTMAEWARMYGINRRTLRSRIVQRGWNVERALTTPAM